MKLNQIVEALNRFFLTKYPSAKGHFIGKESFEPSKINAYKIHKVEIYYHVPGKNYLAFTKQRIDRYLEKFEKEVNELFMIDLISELFLNIQDLEKYEAI